MADDRDTRDFEVSTWQLALVIGLTFALSGAASLLLPDEEAAIAVVAVVVGASAVAARILIAHMPR